MPNYEIKIESLEDRLFRSAEFSTGPIRSVKVEGLRTTIRTGDITSEGRDAILSVLAQLGSVKKTRVSVQGRKGGGHPGKVVG